MTAASAGPLSKRHLGGLFAELCAIESPSRSERACAVRVRTELEAAGIDVVEDDAGRAIGGDCGNLLARIPAAQGAGVAGGDRCVLLCAHLDTVPPQAPIDPVFEDGVWENRNQGILGADNKAAVAVLLELARLWAREAPPVGVELLFTVGEEISLAGSKAFDRALLQSQMGFVFDHATPIGEVIMDSPCHFRIEARFRGAAAHAGISPEEGRSAILAASRGIASLRLGRLEGEGTVNVGTISGGSAINVVPEDCLVVAEVRGVDDQTGERLAGELIDRLQLAANEPDCDCDLDVSVERTFSGYRVSPASAPLRVAEAALRSRGHEPVRVSSGGGSDANTLIAAGLPMVNVANGTKRAHEPGESVSGAALEEMLDVVLALLDESATLAMGAAL